MLKFIRSFVLMTICVLALSAFVIPAFALYWPIFGFSPGFSPGAPVSSGTANAPAKALPGMLKSVAPANGGAVPSVTADAPAKALPGTPEWYAPVIGGAVPVPPGTAYGFDAFHGDIGFF